MVGDPLTPQDLKLLARSWITSDFAEQAGIRRVNSVTGGQVVGRNGRGDYSGLVFPYVWPGETRPRAYRIRRDSPDFEQRSDGSLRAKAKYLAEQGRGNLLYFVPGTPSEWLSEPSIPVLILEGEKKTLAVSRYFRERSESVLVIGISGVWNWRGTIGKANDANGQRVDVKGVIGDIERIEWKAREATILFDANVRSNGSVQAARAQLANALREREADVWLLDLPEDFTSNGVDDFLAERGAEALRTIWGTRYRVTEQLYRKKGEANLAVTVDDFYAHSPSHRYIFVPTRETWSASSVNGRIPPVATGRATKEGEDEYLAPSRWLDRNRAVEQMSWLPGAPIIIRDRLMNFGGWFEHIGARCFNLYQPPLIENGDPNRAEPWLKHVHRIYPEHAAHIISWLAHQVQRPAEKINHALVLGGSQGIGKDTLLTPVRYAIGPWNFVETSPHHLVGRFNGFVKSVILRVNEARDLGDADRYSFYEHMKIYIAAPPDVLRVDEKNLREYYVPNLCGVIITTNYIDGLYLPPDDRRHYVAWCALAKEDFDGSYWRELHHWFENEGNRHVAAYLQAVDLSDFDPKAPPPQTPAWQQIVDSNRAPEDAELADVIDDLGNPDALTIKDLADQALGDFRDWLLNRKFRRIIPRRLETAGYVPVRNDDAKDGQWVINGKRQTAYAKRELSIADRIAAAVELRSK